MAHGHLADHAPSDPRVRRALAYVLVPLALATLAALVLLWPDRPDVDGSQFGLPDNLVRGEIQSVATVPCVETDDDAGLCRSARVRLTSGPDAGDVVPVEVASTGTGVEIAPGRRVVLAEEPEAPTELRYHVVDAERRRPLLLLGLLFAAAVVVLGRWRGLAALGGLVVSLGVLTMFALPALLGGAAPVPIAITAAATIMFATLYLAHGVSVRTSVALLGTMGSLVVTGVLAAVFVGATRLTGLSSEEAIFLGATDSGVDLAGLLLAGVIIGSLGVLDDVTVTQAAAVWELRAANPAYGVRQLYRAGIRIGRDHVASTVNTLVLAYAGASLPLLLLFSVADQSLTEVATSEIVAQELVRTLVGSIGLVASVPLTTGLAALVVGGSRAPADADDEWVAELRQARDD